MNRRAFVTGVGAVLAASLGAEAQPSTTTSRIGLLTDLAWEPLREALRDLGYVEGKNVVFELRRSDGRSEGWPELATELVRLKVDVIVTQDTPATHAAKKATTTARQRHWVHSAWGWSSHQTAGDAQRDRTEAASRGLPLEPPLIRIRSRTSMRRR